MKAIIVFILVIYSTFAMMAGNVKDDIEMANKSGNCVFLVVTEKGNDLTQKAVEIANQAHAKHPKSKVLQMDRSETANQGLVRKYGLAGAPIPLILVFDANGTITGGLPAAQANADMLVRLVPSPVKSEVLKAMNTGKSVFLVVSSKNMKEKNSVMNTCQQACIEMDNNAKLIELDLNDQRESNFISELKIDKQITSPQTFVINSKGQITGSFTDNVNSTALIASAKKLPAARGCCPGGSGAGCGPGK